MGKGDKRSKKGKIAIGSYGNSRLRSKNKAAKNTPAAAASTAVKSVAIDAGDVKLKRTAKKKVTE
jgi:30S ribosomal protein S31